ncbi:ABC transporter ATP-binding protein [Aureimonas psammosilenae]|uniref:ABC transporter ATP-binding protein n=1 Tax=Aureimonas psammosilenae TaxID=2495496 RepID=UPI001260766D|nr:ABC transporter ATP-binding protein [Aureimonas psammosilenae]
MTDLKDNKQGGALRGVFRFTFANWREERGLVVVVAGAICLATLADILVPIFAGRIIDSLAPGNGGDIATAWRALAAMAALGVGFLLFRHISWWTISIFTLRVMQRVGSRGFARVQHLSTDWHANAFSGSTVRQITRGMWALDMMHDTLLVALLPSAVVLVGTVALLGWHWPAMGLVLGLGAAIYIALTATLTLRWVAEAARRSNKEDTKVGGVLADALSCNAVVKAFGAEEREEERLGGALNRWKAQTWTTWRRATWNGTLQATVLWAIRIAITALVLVLWSRGEASPGDVAYVLTTYFVLHGYLRDIGQHVMNLQRSVNDMEELAELDALMPTIRDRPAAKALAVDRGEVRFDTVTFRYGAHATPLYDRLSVTIEAGQSVGLVGHSGSGKTTFVKLIQRLYDVTDGRVLIDGTDIRDATQRSLRRQVAIVPQESILFHRSLSENIAYGRPGASKAEIEAAARLASADGFIERLPQGYETLVGERGVKLSGGERQRVALARAFLADAPILILDEATSSLDSESEVAIQEATARLMKGRTSLVIAHRLSTVRSLDRILVFDRGRIVEDGDHKSLIARANGRYRQLSELQSVSFLAAE